MGVVEDVRQVMQDFLSPELKSLEARLTALEHEVSDLKVEMRGGFSDMRGEMRGGFSRVEATLARLENQINLAQKVEAFNERLSRVEEQRKH